MTNRGLKDCLVIVLCHCKPGPKPTEPRRLILVGFEFHESRGCAVCDASVVT